MNECSPILGFFFYRGSWACTACHILAVVVQVVGREQPVSVLEEVSWYPSSTRPWSAFMNWGIFYGWGPIFRSICFGFNIDWGLANCSRWAHDCFTRLGSSTRLKPLSRHCPLSFLYSVAFLTLGFVSGWGGLYWLLVGWGIRPIFPSTSRNVFIFLIIVGWGQILVFHGVHFIRCVILTLWKICIPCMEVSFTSMYTTSARSRHLKYPCKKLHSGWSM